MELVLWRHAEAENGTPDFARQLTSKGTGQAARMAKWLNAKLPENAHLIVSPAQRAQQTAAALDRPFLTDKNVGLSATVKGVLAVANWPNVSGVVVIIGHQPTLGEIATFLVSDDLMALSFQTGELKWYSSTDEQGAITSVLRHDVYPEML